MNHILAIFNKQKPKISYSGIPEFVYLRPEEIVDGNVDFPKVGKKYGLGSKDAKFTLFGFNLDGSENNDYFPWEEINFCSDNPTIKSSEVQVVGQKLDSYTIQAIRNKIVPIKNNTIENAVQGILVKDGKFILGGRGGMDQTGTLQPIPGGSVSWKENYRVDPFTDAFFNEAKEEAGVTKITEVRLYGIFNQISKHINRQWLFKGKPNESIDQLVENIKEGIDFYDKQLKSGKTGREAKLTLKESNYPIDVWENSNVHSFNYDEDTLLQLLSDGQWINPQGRILKLIGSLPADLYLAGVVDFGVEFKKEADKLELVKNEVVDQT